MTTAATETAAPLTERRTIYLSAYQPHPRNYNRHPADQVKRIAHSLRTFGQVRSIVVWRGYLLAGHGVAEAAKSIGWTTLEADALPDDYPEAKALAYVAADNELSRLSDPDAAQLAAILQESRDTDPELMAAIGYSDQEFESLLKEVEADKVGAATDTEPQIDRAEELRQKWGVEPGQLWQLGEHRLICGDCTDAAVVARVMGEDSMIDLLATDPPFAITGSATGTEDMSGINIIQPFFRLWIANFANMLPLFGHAYICCDFRTYSMIDSTAQQHLRLKNCVIWDKGGGGLGSMYQNCHEMIWFGVREERKRIKANKTGQRTVTGEPNIWRYTPPTFATGKDAPLHTANKPLEMFERMIRNSSDSNDIVADPFSGSGTTLIACENLGRRCRAVEIAPGYVAVALERFYQHTGKTPTLIEGA